MNSNTVFNFKTLVAVFLGMIVFASSQGWADATADNASLEDRIDEAKRKCDLIDPSKSAQAKTDREACERGVSVLRNSGRAELEKTRQCTTFASDLKKDYEAIIDACSRAGLSEKRCLEEMDGCEKADKDDDSRADLTSDEFEGIVSGDKNCSALYPPACRIMATADLQHLQEQDKYLKDEKQRLQDKVNSAKEKVNSKNQEIMQAQHQQDTDLQNIHNEVEALNSKLRQDNITIDNQSGAAQKDNRDKKTGIDNSYMQMRSQTRKKETDLIKIRVAAKAACQKEATQKYKEDAKLKKAGKNFDSAASPAVAERLFKLRKAAYYNECMAMAKETVMTANKDMHDFVEDMQEQSNALQVARATLDVDLNNTLAQLQTQKGEIRTKYEGDYNRLKAKNQKSIEQFEQKKQLLISERWQAMEEQQRLAQELAVYERKFSENELRKQCAQQVGGRKAAAKSGSTSTDPVEAFFKGRSKMRVVRNACESRECFSAGGVQATCRAFGDLTGTSYPPLRTQTPATGAPATPTTPAAGAPAAAPAQPPARPPQQRPPAAPSRRAPSGGRAT